MGFSAQWLALREPADQKARDPALLTRAVAAAGPAPVILDLGCGTGSTVRALAPHLPETARWHLVDNDPLLLDQASAEAPGRVQVHELDLAQLDALPLEGVTLVTASALLDLMPAAWIEDLAAILAAAGLPFYAALSYDGIMSWEPALPKDHDVTRAFNDHQRSDKGLGPALGPDAGTVAATIFRAAGFNVQQAISPWRIAAEAVPLHRALVEGIADAAGQAGQPMAAEWGRARAGMASESRCLIGHLDLLALPPRTA
ncbi:class I SAM-dependent methyltransferase [Paracoccus rhizosphaerae]|uniref:Class I SAM-dependent methyltransferase n=1 Tax=Paracoccus rhizosphaerae TaxID=1133347 RepID=A0ABV6CEL0_9RHOB|nr:class I SAM-dependent methyltransferase [Paracoccus rhizosphaerae]